MRNIILTGFMATGKTTIGHHVAKKLGWTFIDIDSLIAQQAGKPIPAIFEEEGEWRFREWENRVCTSLQDTSHCVIATGGGTIMYKPNRLLLEQLGTLVCLHASLDTVIKRLQTSAERPLLTGKTRADIATLWRERQFVYNSVELQISTDTVELSTVMENIVEKVRFHEAAMENVWVTIQTPFGKKYPIINGSAVKVPRHAVLVYDPAVTFMPTSLATVEKAIPFPQEKSPKSLESVRFLYETFSKLGIHRGHTLIAMGGGTLLDAVGFAAATYMRGIPVINIPTTLLSMVDAGFGGKTGVDVQAGKNLVGAFHHPEAVYIDPLFLKSLSPREIACGMAEVIKHAIIGDAVLWELLRTSDDVKNFISRAIQVKARIVEEDPFETGEQRLRLNLGHTFAHGFEQASGYTIPHGEAVAAGLVAAAKLGVLLGITSPQLVANMTHMIERYHLPTAFPALSVDAVLQAMQQDKKRTTTGLRLIVPRAIGDVCIVDGTEESALRAVLV